MKESNEENKAFMMCESWYKLMNKLCRTDKQRAECLFALCDFAFYGKKYEGKNMVAESVVEMAMPAIEKQRKKYISDKTKYNNKNNIKENNYNSTYTSYDNDEEERRKIIELIKNQKKKSV